MSTTLKQKNINNFYILLSCSVNHAGYEVFTVSMNEDLGGVYTTTAQKDYSNKKSAEKAFYNYCTIANRK